MENFLSTEDKEFLQISKVFNKFDIRRKHVMISNKGLYIEEPNEKDRQEITHMFDFSIYNSTHKIANYPKLKFLNCGDIKNTDFASLVNLETVIVSFGFIGSSKFLDLPNIKTLIFTELDYYYKVHKNTILPLNNLPITLEQIIFISSVDNINYMCDYLKDKMYMIKIPFGCKILLIDYRNKIHTIMD